MENQITTKPEVKIGEWYRSSMLYDFSVFLQFGEISAIRMFFNEWVIGLEVFFEGTSAGIVKGDQVDLSKQGIESDIIVLQKNEMIIEISGTKSKDGINCVRLRTNLNNTKSFGKSNLGEEFIYTFPNTYLRNLKAAFEKNCLCYIEPNFDFLSNYEVKPSNLIMCNDPGIQQTKTLGKVNKNIKHFNDYEVIKGKNARITEIKLHDDGDYVKGIYFKYNVEEYLAHLEQRCPKTKDHLLKLQEDEFINKIYVRSGDWIDHISIYTNKGNVISAGGFGGGPSVFVVPEGKRFIGISGGVSNYLNWFSAYYE